MGELDGPEGAQQESTVPEEDKFEGQLVPQVWKGRDSESNLFLRNLSQFIWTLLHVRVHNRESVFANRLKDGSHIFPFFRTSRRL